MNIATIAKGEIAICAGKIVNPLVKSLRGKMSDKTSYGKVLDSPHAKKP